MAKRKNLEALSAQELYELARRREQEELEDERESVKGEIETLRAQRRELLAQQKKELAAVDKEINSLKRRIGASAAGRGGARGNSNISQAVLDVIANAGGRASTKDIKSGLDQAGVETANLGQCLAYLKRKGRITSPGRAVYALV